MNTPQHPILHDMHDLDRALLDFMLRNTADAVSCMTLDGTLIAFSKAAERIFGYSAGEMTGRHLDELFPLFASPDVIEQEKARLARAVAGEEIPPYETTRKRKDGTTLSLLLSTHPIRNSQGQVIAVVRVTRDITQERSHQQDRALLAQIVQSSSDAIISYDLDATVTSWNPAAEKIYGHTAAEMLGTNLKQRLGEFVAPERIAVELELNERAAAGEVIPPFEAVRARKDGTKVTVLAAVSAIRDGSGKVIGVSRVVRDISEHKAHEAQKALLGAIVESSNDAIYTKSLDGIITSWNSAAEMLFGYSAGEIIGKPVQLLFVPERRLEEVEILARTRQGETMRHFETVRVRKDGSRIDVSVTASPLRDPDDRIIGVSSTVRDITERKASEARLKAMQDELIHVGRLTELSQISAGIAHELNQPLTAMVNYSNAARRVIAIGDRQSTEKALDAVSKAAEQALRAAEIIRRMRGFVEKHETRRAVEDVNAIVQDSVTLGLIGAHGNNVRTRLELAAELPDVLVDRVQIQQVLVNLIRNAVDAMAQSPQREITLSTRALDDGEVEVSVADTGPGIPKEHADRLFMPFFTTKPGGLGIGLVISQTIVHAHGGSISAGPNPGGGTVFRFTLPAALPTSS